MSLNSVQNKNSDYPSAAVDARALLPFSSFSLLLSSLCITAFLFSPWVLATGTETIRIENLRTHSRLMIRLDESVPAEWKNKSDGFEIFLKGIGLTDLGAPLGEEQAWQAQFQDPQAMQGEPRIQSLRIEEVPGGVRVQGKWKFPSGTEALKDPKMEAFDYRDKTPPQYVVDFWTGKSPTIAAVKSSELKASRAAALRKQEEQARARASRKLASERARADAYDIGRFCREPLQEGKDVFLKFNPYHEAVDFSRWISVTTPDSAYDYFEPKTQEKDAQYVRLALDLYRQGKLGLAVRTLEFFEPEHPDSPFRYEMKFLKANALLKLGHEEPAMALLRQLMAAGKDVPPALHSAMYIAAKDAFKKSSLAAFESFSWLASHYPEHRMAWVFHLGIAESLAGLKQTDRAAKEYQWILEHAPDRKGRAEAAARLGDIYMDRFDYPRALEGYSQALEHFPEEMKSHPSVHLNRAEALFGLGVMEKEEALEDGHVLPAGNAEEGRPEAGYLERSREAFQAFLKDYPSHSSGWRATFRLGEIEGHELARTAESRKWFYETINRFPFSTGATLARMRLIPCDDHGGFQVESAQRFFETEALSFDGHGELPLIHYREFRTLAQIRSLLSWNRYEDAVAILTREMGANPTSRMKPAMQQMFAVLFRKRIIELIDQGKKYEALAFYNRKLPMLPREGRSFDPDYLLKLSQAASDLGLAKLGQQLAREYAKQTSPTPVAAEAGGRAIAATGGPTPAKAKAKANENDLAAPGRDSADLADQLKLAEQSFAEAKGSWLATGAQEEQRVRGLLSKVIEESPFFVEREIILGLLDESRGEISSALAHATRAQLASPGLRMDAWLAHLESLAGDPRIALELYKSLEGRLSGAKESMSGAKESMSGAKESMSGAKESMSGAKESMSGAKESMSGAKVSKPAAVERKGPEAAEILGVPSVPSREEIVLAEAGILERQGRWGDAAGRYGAAVDLGFGGGQAKFGYAHALLKSGGKVNRAKAQEVLKLLSQASEAAKPPREESEKWRRLAQETLAHLNDQARMLSAPRTSDPSSIMKRSPTGNAKEGMK